MVLDCRDFDGLGRPGPFCQEVTRECAARNFSGVVCDFEAGRLPPLEETVAQLGNECSRRGWNLLVPEHYASCSPHAQVMISSALSGGSLELRLEEARQRFGRERVVLALQRSAEDFFLPSPTGGGRPLTQEQLHRLMEERSPSVFFSRELCARYFTYMSRDSGAHFVLFDDDQTLVKKGGGSPQCGDFHRRWRLDRSTGCRSCPGLILLPRPRADSSLTNLLHTFIIKPSKFDKGKDVPHGSSHRLLEF